MDPTVVLSRDEPQPHRPLFYAAASRFAAGTSDAGCYLQWQVGLIEAGTCVYQIDGRDLESHRGDFFITRSARMIKWRVPEEAGDVGWEPTYCVFDPRPHWLPWLQFPEAVPGCALLHLEGTPLFAKVRRMLATIIKLNHGGSPQHNDWAMLVLERLLLVLHGSRLQQETDPRVHLALQLINAQYVRDWTVEELAGECHTSASRLAVLFQRAVGVAPIQYLEQVRMRRAMEMLALGGASSAEIARQVGYVLSLIHI